MPVIPPAVAALARHVKKRTEQTWLRRWYLAPRMKGTKLDLKLDFASSLTLVKATADFSFRPQVTSSTFTCLLGDVSIFSATWKGEPVKARVSSPFVVLKFPKTLESFVETSLQIRYSYAPDQNGTIFQPVTKDDFAERITITCRRPLLGVVQGKLVQGTENPPLRTYLWEPSRCRKLNAIVADVRTFRKATSDGMSMWLHLHADGVPYAPHILDLLIALYEESAAAHHRKLGHENFHVVESDERGTTPFNSPGLIVVPRGTFATDDKPTVYGVLAPELNKEWARDPTNVMQMRWD